MLTQHFARRKHDAPTLVNAEGQPLATEPQRRTWCRLVFIVSLEPPKFGQVFRVDNGPFTRKVTIFAPRSVVAAVTAALVGSVPWVQNVIQWALHLAR